MRGTSNTDTRNGPLLTARAVHAAAMLFYHFRLEDQIPEDHVIRLIDKHVDLSFVRERLKPFYSSTGRASIDPEVLLHLLHAVGRDANSHWRHCVLRGSHPERPDLFAIPTSGASLVAVTIVTDSQEE